MGRPVPGKLPLRDSWVAFSRHPIRPSYQVKEFNGAFDTGRQEKPFTIPPDLGIHPIHIDVGLSQGTS